MFDLIRQVAPPARLVKEAARARSWWQAIHASSGRAEAPFIAINCGNIPSDLLESELFGHVRGLSPANVSRKGLFEASGGTLFLDEVATISLEIQAKLLRAIQEREFRRLGSSENIRVDVRIVAATNTDLEAGIREGTFREDLYYRLNVIAIKIPPLRERSEDVQLLAEFFLRKYAAENGRDPLTLDPAALRVLLDYRWPGNVRELENVIERAVVLAPGDRIGPDLFPAGLTAPPPDLPPDFVSDGVSLKERVNEYEKSLLLAALERTDWNQKKAAELLSVNTTTLSEKLKRFGIRRERPQS